MTSTSFFIIFISILAILLLAINLILARHNLLIWIRKSNIRVKLWNSLIGIRVWIYRICFDIHRIFTNLFIIFKNNKRILTVFLFVMGIIHYIELDIFYSVILLAYILGLFLVSPLLAENLDIKGLEILLTFVFYYIIGIITLLDKVISQQFVANYTYLSPIQILLLHMGIAMLILPAIIYNKESISLGDMIKNRLEILDFIYSNFKKNPLSCIIIAMLLIGSLMIIDIIYSWLGVTVCYESYMSYCITIFSRVIFTKILLLLILLPISKKDRWSKIIGVSILIPLAMIPSSYIYFYYLLP